MSDVNYAATIQATVADADFAIVGNDYSTLLWNGPGDAPTQAELDAAWPAVRVARQNAEAAANRGAAYAAEADPLFFYWQAGEGTEEAWLAKRAEIRDRYPYTEVDDAGA